MKKKLIVSLVAAALCAMMISTAVFAAGFSDEGKIGRAYKTAVSEMSARNVINGFTDGTFRPADTLTREQAAKIITYIILGHEAAEKLTCTEAPYDDVGQSRWSAGCIQWCRDNGIINGYGNGKFGPEDILTGYQFTKMLLCALEYGTSDKYVGTQWTKAVDADGFRFGLFDGDSSMASDKPLQRQQAALLANNAVNEKAAGGTPSVPSGTQPGPAPSVSPSPLPPDGPGNQDPDPYEDEDDNGDIILPEV
ncbi:MAG: S-layer homology domain-containing protein [Oscillospiraceae bacterium]|nr:S-layer homology domain-containing protein [Oscillospiraceae bacterium]